MTKKKQSNTKKTRAKIIAVSNIKGGVAKTTTSVNLAAAFAVKGKKVLLIDGDFQGNAGDALGLRIPAILAKNTFIDAIVNKKRVEDVIYPSEFENLDMICSSSDLEFFDDMGFTYNRVKKFIDVPYIHETYDYVVIDTRPQAGSLYTNLLSISDWYLAPVFAEADAMSGLKILFRKLHKIQDAYNPEIKCAGILVTNYREKESTHKVFLKVLKNTAKDLGLPSLGVIPFSAAQSTAVNQRIPIPFNTRSLKVKDCYLELADNLIKSLVFKKGRIPKIPVVSQEAELNTLSFLHDVENGNIPEHDLSLILAQSDSNQDLSLAFE